VGVRVRVRKEGCIYTGAPWPWQSRSGSHGDGRRRPRLGSGARVGKADTAPHVRRRQNRQTRFLHTRLSFPCAPAKGGVQCEWDARDGWWSGRVDMTGWVSTIFTPPRILGRVHLTVGNRSGYRGNRSYPSGSVRKTLGYRSLTEPSKP
jgi:hypothetical protein